MVERNTQLCRVALKVVGSVGTRLTPHLCNALPTGRPNLLHNIMLIQNTTEYNKIFQNIPTLFTNHCSVLQNILPIQNITEYNKIFQNILTLFTNRPSVLQNILHIQNITEYKKILKNIPPLNILPIQGIIESN